MKFRDRLRQWQDRRAIRPIAPALQQASNRLWTAFLNDIGQGRSVFEAKWNLEGWDSNNRPPRPRSVEELAQELSVTPETVVAMDWDLIDFLRERRKVDYWQGDFVCVPVAGAQEWWDSEYGWYCFWDGGMKPESQKTEHIPHPPIPDDSHAIEDEVELRRHLVEDHGCEWAEQSRIIEMGHRQQHKHEAEDRYWDSQFRS